MICSSFKSEKIGCSSLNSKRMLLSAICQLVPAPSILYKFKCSFQRAFVSSYSSIDFFLSISTGFWIREAFYREQPSVVFKHGILLVLGMRDGSYVTWSTYSNFNLLEQSHLIIPVVKVKWTWALSYLRVCYASTNSCFDVRLIDQFQN